MKKRNDMPAAPFPGTPAQRNYKDTVFRMLYQDKTELLELYNAVNGTQYSNPEELEAAGLENAVYMSMKNDVSCVVDLRLNLYEHQSTVNPNMPLRDLFYIAKNEELLGKCRSLHDYMKYVERVRSYSRKMDFQEAVERAVSECIEEGILEEFLRANRAEVIQMSIFEYDEELHMATVREEGRNEGVSRLLVGMLERGLSPEEISELTGEPVETIREAVSWVDH